MVFLNSLLKLHAKLISTDKLEYFKFIQNNLEPFRVVFRKYKRCGIIK